MFRAVIRSSALRPCVSAMAAIVDEAVFKVNPQGMMSNAVDPANAALLSIDMPETAFIEYDVTEAEFGIDLNRFVEIIGMAEKDDEIELGIDDDTHQMTISMSGLSYTMSLLDPSSMRKSTQVPELDLPAQITLSGSAFKRMVKAAGMVGDNMMVGVDGDTPFMEADGDTEKVHLDVTGDDLIGLKPADVSTLYSLDYLSDMSKGIGATSEITIDLGRDLPMVLDFSPYPRCDVTYVLAPRIEPE